MDQRTQGALMLAVGGVSVRLGLTGAALNFIKPGYVPLLVAAGVILLVLGGLTLVAGLRDPADDTADHGHGDDHDHDQAAPIGAPLLDDMVVQHAEVHGTTTADAPTDAADDLHGHDHSRGPRVAWMLAAPLFAVLLIAPPPLGSYAAARQSGVVRTVSTSFPDLPPAEDGAIPMTMGDYAARALYDTERSLEGERLRLTGFVSDVTEDGWVLTRFALSCCAADGTAIDVLVKGDGPTPPVDQWLVAEGTWTPTEGHEIGELTADPPVLLADTVTPIDQPEQPYES